MAAAPLRTALADTYPAPSNATFKTGIGAFWDFVTELLGITGTKQAALDALRLLDADAVYNLSLVPSVAASALTMNVKTRAGAAPSATDPVMVSQRNATAGSGDFNLRTITGALALVFSSGSTLGHASAVQGAIYWYLLDNGGVQELAASTSYFGKSGIVSTTAEGGAGGADSATVMYSATARTNLPFRCIGRTLDTQTTAGVWAAVPTLQELIVDSPAQNRLNVAEAIGGTVDAITATFRPAFPSLIDKTRVIVRAAGANATTTPTLAVDGLTAKTIVKGNLAALAVGDIVGAGHELELLYNIAADKWVLLNPYVTPTAAAVAASQAEQEAASSTSVFVTPGRQQFHPSACKAWARYTEITTTAITASYGVSSLTDNGVGTTTVNWATAFSASTAYGCVGMSRNSNASNGNANCQDYATGSVKMYSTDLAGTPTDMDLNMIAAFGDQ